MEIVLGAIVGATAVYAAVVVVTTVITILNDRKQ